MPPKTATLYLLCGKIAAGKSTMAARLTETKEAVRISEDDWLGALFADQMSTPADYVRCAGKLRSIIGPHVAVLLKAGVSVVLDFPANTRETRAWMRGILDQTGVPHELHVLTPPDSVCLERLHARNGGGDHPFEVTEAQFELFSKHFVPPAPEEGFTLVIHD